MTCSEGVIHRILFPKFHYSQILNLCTYCSPVYSLPHFSHTNFLRQNTRHCFCCLKELCNMNIFHESHTLPPSHPIKMDALTSFRGDPITEFTTGLSKAYLQEERDLAPYPCLPSIAQFKETVMKRISQKSFKWYTGNGGLEGGQSSDTSINVAYVIRTEWMYGLLRASEYEHKQVISSPHSRGAKLGFRGDHRKVS